MSTKLLAALAALGSLTAGAVVWEGGPDPVVYPPQHIPIRFTHDYHTRKPGDAVDDRGQTVKVDGEGLSCEFCHENVGSSTSAATLDIPGHAACESCHEDWIGEKGKAEPVEECVRCHVDPNVVTTYEAAAKLVIPRPNLNFPHKSHVDAGVKCVECHKDVPKKTLATRDDYPTMDRCVECHAERGVSTACGTCHLTQPSGRLITELPQGKLMPRRLHTFAIHDPAFLREHAVPAKRDKQYCNSCHNEDFCLTCHDGVGRDARFHPGDWLALHGSRAKIDDNRCQSCHRLQTYCMDCHVRSGVASVNPGALVAAVQNLSERRTIRREGNVATGPHPMAADGWITPTSRNFHGFFAQRNIRTCASCHQEQYCITCHSSQFLGPGKFGTGLGGNPHGANPQRLRDGTARSHNARMCLKCHSPADPSWR